MPVMPRVQDVVLPILRSAPSLDGVTFYTWIPDIDHRSFPFVNIRRVGGLRHETRPLDLSMPVIEVIAIGTDDLPTTEQLYEDVLEVLFKAVKRQTQTPAGYLHSIKETRGGTQFGSLFQDSWRIQGLIKLGVRPPRNP